MAAATDECPGSGLRRQGGDFYDVPCSTPKGPCGAQPFDIRLSPVRRTPWERERTPYSYSPGYVTADSSAALDPDDEFFSAVSSTCPGAGEDEDEGADEDDSCGVPLVQRRPSNLFEDSEEDCMTPAIQRRNARLRRFNCKRRLTFQDTKEWAMNGEQSCLAGDDEPVQLQDPPAQLMRDYQRSDLGMELDDDGDELVEIVYGPLPKHKFVPLWVFVARTHRPAVFAVALNYFMVNHVWPPLCMMDESFQEDCEEDGVRADVYEKTVGFAPAWLFVLNTISKAGKLDQEWFRICVDYFFDEGTFPALSTLPDELQDACERLDLGDYDYYADRL